MLTDEQRQEMVRLYLRGDPVHEIAERFGVNRCYPRRLAKQDKYLKRIKKRAQQAIQPKPTVVRPIKQPVAPRRSADSFIAIELAIELQPYDTRPFTARFFGDPLPGRSALDQKRAAECQ